MKVLIIDVNCKHSSTGKIVYDLYTQLKKTSHKVRVCYGRGSLVKEPDIYKFSSNIEVYFHALLTRLTGLTGIYSHFATRRLLKLIEEFNPDVVHIHELHAYFVNITPLMNYLKQKNIKTIWTFHCEFMYTGKCGHAYECEKWKTECNHCPKLHDYPSSLFLDFTKQMFYSKRRMFQNFNNLIIVTPSQWLADRVRASFLKDKDIQVIHNGIDINVFCPREFKHLREKYNLTDEKIVLAVAPNLMSESKGGHWILELAKRFKNENVKFLLIGVDDLTKDYDDNVIALGKKSNQIELAEYYSLADVVILANKKETFSLVCAESLSCGTPVIGFDAGAPSEVAPKGYGIFVEYGNIDELTEVFKDFLNGKINFNSSNELIEYAQRNYSKEVMFNNYFNIY